MTRIGIKIVKKFKNTQFATEKYSEINKIEVALSIGYDSEVAFLQIRWEFDRLACRFGEMLFVVMAER